MRRTILSFAVLASLAAGCGAPEASFVYNERTKSLPPEAQEGSTTEDGVEVKGLKSVVEEHFGTPQNLVAWLKLPVNYGGTEEQAATVVGADEPPSFSIAQADGEALAQYSSQPGFTLASGRALYMEHCLHCHGTSGDGAGPTAEYLNPRPRDYRKGLFKFTSTKEGEHVTRDDLTRIIKLGIPGTYMPSFLLLEDEEIAAIVEYVRWLSMRGEVEYALGAQLVSDFSTKAIQDRVEGGETKDEIMAELKETLADIDTLVSEAGDEIADAWSRAEEPETQIVPSIARVEDTEESRRRGRAVFISAAAKCTNCHGPQGLGNGRQTEEYETNEETGKKWDEPGLHDKWGNIVQPRNLKTGIYRGGRRPIDIFRRVRAGVKGSGMPAFGESVIPDEDLWHLVNYVKSIPFGETAPAPAAATKENATEPAG